MRSLVAATATVAVLARSAIAEEPKKGSTLVTVPGTDVRNLKPAVQSGIVTGYSGSQLFAAPLRYDEN